MLQLFTLLGQKQQDVFSGFDYAKLQIANFS